MLVKPHGHSELNPLLVEEAERSDRLAEAKTLRPISITSREFLICSCLVWELTVH